MSTDVRLSSDSGDPGNLGVADPDRHRILTRPNVSAYLHRDRTLFPHQDAHHVGRGTPRNTRIQINLG